MSPLPETPFDKIIYTGDKTRYFIFFNEEIKPDEKKIWEVHMGGKDKESVLFELMSVNFDNAVENYSTEHGNGRLFHKVFSTPQKGVYLELVFKDFDIAQSDKKTMFDGSLYARFHRLGEKANQDYIDSITNG